MLKLKVFVLLDIIMQMSLLMTTGIVVMKLYF